ncbi:MAG: hypothetical protein ABH845_06835, partial [Candidatus Omnitrophota bacterium]
HTTEAFYIAEGALKQILFDLRRDMSDSSDWFDGDINGLIVDGSPIPAPNPTTWTYACKNAAMGDGIFSVELKEIVGNRAAMLVRTTGTSSGITQKLLTAVQMVNLNAWNNVIFSGTGQAGHAISGNVDIRGSVHILGTSLIATDLAMDLSGSGNIGNNYVGMPAILRSRVPNPPTVDFNGEMVESLGAEVRIKRGKLGLSGTALAGSVDVIGNTVKETLDSIYVTDGYGGNQGSLNVNSDNGIANGYDVGDAVTFQNFSNSYKDDDGTVYPTYSDYIAAKGMDLSTIAGWSGKIDDTTASFTGTDVHGNSIAWNQATGILNVSGVIYANGSVDIGKKSTTIMYDGIGTLVTLGANSDIIIHGNIYSQGQFTTDDTMAFIAERNVEVATGGGESQINVTGLFYAQNQITSAKQSQLVGVFNANYFDMGSQVPSIYHVPSFDPANHPGLIARNPIFFMKHSSWQEVQ